ncbi:M23 family metallopeptidase [Pseudomonas chlororaphis]|uniref:M23 family metallopeptidase n=1 Tax=Pseudomonas chlororaphis TaxID=587753 RepID=UPI002368ACA5|nr:M23 family metallopeptidase [Pseudomonas chlororaphis]WDG79746.1 M23 family metallopeptidase [Pseudomonas chlororaphis]WDG87202.1 M23 family metallopeptidase [Pseudomonas chlororaphis]
MIIGPPFIPAPVTGETDAAFLERAMVGGVPGDGGFPLSFDLNWHGGVHLTSPQENEKFLPARAIADGKLAYFRNPETEVVDADHPLRFRRGWTDNGCIVLRHETETETEIGEGTQSTVVFYSIYMHLSKINLTQPQVGMTIYRKDNIGEAGSIYGDKGRIHFEIVADQSQIAHLVGRATRDLDYQLNNGRTDSCWGDMYFFVPPEVLLYGTAPSDRRQSQNNAPVVYRCPAMPTYAPVQEAGNPSPSASSPSTVDGYEWAVASQLQQGIFVRMNYERGQCTLTSFYVSGVEIGAQPEEADYEHNLYTIAKRLYPQSPSAGYELLRFGRLLGSDTLQPADAAHWRQIKFPGKAGEQSKVGWVNLNAPTVAKFSDADFPQWQGWRLIDDDVDTDSDCQSPFIRSLLELGQDTVQSSNNDTVSIAKSPGYAALSQEEKQQLSERYSNEHELSMSRLSSPDIQKQIKRLVCKFPTEWKLSDFDIRYEWLLKVSDGGPMPQDKYDKLKAYQSSLAFWEQASLVGIDSKHWHFHPVEFIRAFRKCSWLSLEEFAYTLPKYHFYEASGTTWVCHTAGAASVYQISHATAKSRFQSHYVNMNKIMFKYGLVSVTRKSHFLAQTILETDRWRTISEYGSGNPNPNIPMAQYYAEFYGRGIMQLTWAGNYEKYGEYRSSALPTTVNSQYTDSRITATSNHYWADPTQRNSNNQIIGVIGVPKRWAPRYDPNLIKSNSYNACGSGGFYWISKVINRSDDININRECDKVFDAARVGSISVLVNGGGNGYHERQAYAQYVYRYLSDSVATSITETVTTPRRPVTINFSMSKPL